MLHSYGMTPSAKGNLVHSLDNVNPAKLIISAMNEHNMTSSGDKALYREDQYYLGVLEGENLRCLYQIMSGGPSRGTVALEANDGPSQGSQVRVRISFSSSHRLKYSDVRPIDISPPKQRGGHKQTHFGHFGANLRHSQYKLGV